MSGGVLKTEQRLAEEVAEVCRDYCSVTWDATLNSAGVPTESELRKAERVFYPEHIKEILTNPSSAALPSPSLEQVPSVQDLPIDVRTSAEKPKDGDSAKTIVAKKDLLLKKK